MSSEEISKVEEGLSEGVQSYPQKKSEGDQSSPQKKSKGDQSSPSSAAIYCNRLCSLCYYSTEAVQLLQKVIAEVIGTFFVIFAGCGSIVVNRLYGEIITSPGICVVWGLIVMVMIFSVGHISGAHFNPAVTITFAIFRRFPLLQVPIYIVSQLLGSILASGTLSIIFDVPPEAYYGTVPVGPHWRSLVIEIIISFLLMFVLSGVATDHRAIGEQAGIAVGMTILLNVFIAGPISGASMNPARSLGPALVMKVTKGQWVYVAGPIVGTILGGFAYNLVRFADEKSISEQTNKSASHVKGILRTRNNVVSV